MWGKKEKKPSNTSTSVVKNSRGINQVQKKTAKKQKREGVATAHNWFGLYSVAD